MKCLTLSHATLLSIWSEYDYFLYTSVIMSSWLTMTADWTARFYSWEQANISMGLQPVAVITATEL